jgi:hypothetical protein
MSEDSDDLEMTAKLHESTRFPASIAPGTSKLLGLEAIDRVQAIDRVMEEHRQAMAVLAAVRDDAIRELAGTTSVLEAAQALGVTRQAIYKAFQERRSLTLSGDSVGTTMTQRKIEQLQNDIVKLQGRIAQETKKQVASSDRLNRALQQQAKTRSSATAQSKQREAERLQKDIVASQRRRAEFEKQVARKTPELHRNQSKLVKEQASERDRMLKRLEAASSERERAALSAVTTQIGYEPVRGDETGVDIQMRDVFISHATEDKREVARPLAKALHELGLRVWYDEFELRVGDSLRRRIDNGLARSRFGIVVLSPAFFAKNWPQYELDGLVAKEMQDRRKVILPLWHKVSKDEVMLQSPSLADKVALSTSQFTVVELAKELSNAMKVT